MPKNAVCGLLAGMLMFLAAALGASPFFPAGCTVVLMTGIPGDVESESTYQDQLREWVRLVQASPASRCLVLADDPELIALPEQSRFQALKADREHFLGLGPSLSDRTNALVVIVWGHGGKQGETPVFHVRGPRLTPSDFESLAPRSAGGDSRWVLLFKGSGSFGARLASTNRWVLSSDCEQMFASDPAGMGVLLKLVRSRPEDPVESLAGRFGDGVAQWYRDQNLARTEEPTLWTGNQEPRLLAASGAESGVQSASTSGVAAETNETVPAASTRETLSTNLPPVWKEIKPVALNGYPGADAVVLRRRISYTFGSSPAVMGEREEFIQILAPEGKRYGDFDVAYSPPFEDIGFLDCEVLRPDGQLERIDPDSVREARQESVGDYQRERRKFFSLPGVAPGAVLHVRYQTRWKEFPLPEISMEVPVGGELPVMESAIEIRVPKDKAFHYAFENVEAGAPAVRQESYGTSYSWQLGSLPASRHEILSQRRQQEPRLLVSTFADWRAFSDWYGRISELADEVTPDIAARAGELTRNISDDRQKVLALYNYVAALRYVAVPLGVNSFRPHAAARVLENQYGDCKDKANLFNALLHAVKLDAQLVLVPRFSQAREDVPGFAFNHAISRVRLGGQTLWVDTTDDVCRFGMLPPGDSGRRVLVMDGSGALTELPRPAAAEHCLTLRGELDCTRPEKAVPASLTVTATGYPDYELRTMAREARERQASLPLLAARFEPVGGAFAMDRQQSSSVAALDENFKWQARGEWVGGALALSNAQSGPMRIRLRPPFWWPAEWDWALHRRQGGLFLNQGYPLTLDEEFKIVLPAHTTVLETPAGCQGGADMLGWRVDWSRDSEGGLRARLHVELARGELSVAETPALQEQLKSLRSALEREVTANREE